LIALVPTLALVAGLVLATETIVHHTVNPGDDPNIKAFGVNFNASSPITWIIALFLIVAGSVAARLTWRRLAQAWGDALSAAHERGYHA
jgi:branched-chain amino acid transport system permease protein